MKNNFFNFYSQFKYNKLFKKTMKHYFVIALMVFLAYALVMVLNVYNAAKKQIISAEQKMLSQSETTNDFILRNLNSTANDIFENEMVAIDAMSKPYNPTHSAKIVTFISQIKNRMSAIDKLYFFNLDNDCIYTGDHPVYNKESFPDKELLELISDPRQYLISVPHMLKYEKGNKITEEPMLVSIYKYSDTSCMAVFVKSSTFNSIVNTEFVNSNQSMTIVQSNGTVLSSTTPDLFGQNISEDKIVKRIINKNKQSGFINYFGKIYCFRKSNTLNSLYICNFNSSSIVVSYIWLFIVIIVFALLLLILYFISSIKMSVSMFRPFYKLRNNLYDILGIESDDLKSYYGTEKDLRIISKNLLDIKARYDSMQENEQLYSETKRNELVYNIMTGAYNYKEQDLQEYNIYFTHPYNTLLLLRLDNTKNIERSNIGLILYSIANAGTEIFTSQDINAYFTTYSDEFDIVFVLNHKPVNIDMKLITLLQKYTKSSFDVTITAAFDTAEGNHEVLTQLFKNVKHAMQYRVVKGCGAVISYRDFANRSSIKNDYPSKLEKIILREIKQKDKEKIINAVDNFMMTISGMSYTYIVVNSCILISAINSVITSDEKSDESDGDENSEEIMKAETLDDIKNIIIAKCNDAMIAISDVGINDRYVMIANSIEEYIDAHYTESNLSIDIIASYVNKSVNYTRSIFKQNKGISISDYITKKRFGEAMRLLVETNLTGLVIDQKIGTNAGSYFYTAFRKYTGYTPEQYRKKYKAQDNE